MKKLLLVLVLGSIALVSCKKEDPIQPIQPTPPSSTTTTGGSVQDTLTAKFVVKTIVPVAEVDSIVLIHWDALGSVELERIVILPSVNLPTITNTLIFSGSDVVGVADTLDPMGEPFTMNIYMNTATNHNDTQNKFEMGYNSPISTASTFLTFSFENGLGKLDGMDFH